MQKDFNDQWNEFYRQCINKPITEITELNIRTWNNISKHNDFFDKFFAARKWEDIVAAQMNAANIAGVEGLNYTQQAFNIWLNASANISKMFTSAFNHGAARKTAEEMA